MDSPFQIWVDRLQKGAVQKINETTAADFLDAEEEELRFDAPLEVQAKAYLSDQELIIQMSAKTKVKMPCAICNEMIEIPLAISNHYHAEPIEQIRSGIFDFQELLREAILLELPQYTECFGKCPKRSDLAPYLHSGKKVEKTHFPFQQLDD